MYNAETNLVDRPSAQVRFRSRVHDRVFWLTIILQACELSRAEMMASVPAFLDKLARHRPRFVCFVGMIIWEIVRGSLVKLQQQGTVKRMEKGKSREKNQMGLQTYKLVYGDARGMFLVHVFTTPTICIHVHATLSRLASEDISFRRAVHVRAGGTVPGLSRSTPGSFIA